MFSFGNFFKKKQIEILSPVDGEVINITDVDDEVFNEKMLGDGVALIPAANEFYAPFAGTITSIFPTNHAYGMDWQPFLGHFLCRLVFSKFNGS
ncbi:PTS sugar transporter subunit IIA [Spiroplasma endosymbiont of Lonchoptera lutea]|uniref:PTS sugar transporter subunit IIA n=1 Tax=Spiroplasma endosymbiont of Lonchoptera lutea TaxID=3066297 RepID=UPI0030CBBD1A